VLLDDPTAGHDGVGDSLVSAPPRTGRIAVARYVLHCAGDSGSRAQLMNRCGGSCQQTHSVTSRRLLSSDLESLQSKMHVRFEFNARCNPKDRFGLEVAQTRRHEGRAQEPVLSSHKKTTKPVNFASAF
jgi:hypothetical protein